MELENFKYNLARLKKCNQYWDEMEPVAGGRLCGKCDKKIVDFSNMSFTDIAIYMSESKEPVCGFYRPEQLAQTKPAKSKLPLALGLTTLLAASSLAKAEKAYPQTEQTAEKQPARDLRPGSSFPGDIHKIDTLYLIGNVLSFDTAKMMNAPVSYASVMIKGATTGVVTSDNGNFRLPYVPTLDSGKLYLTISSIGFETREVEVVYTGQKRIDLGIITLYQYAEITEFWVTVRKRSKLTMFWRKITKPFRR